MNTYTERSYESEHQAESVNHCQDSGTSQSRYETLLEQQHLTDEARELQQQ